MLAVLPPDRLRVAISGADHNALMAVPGIGRKGAERIILELKDRIGPPVSIATPAAGAWRDQVREALQGLGWSARDADAAAEAVAPEAESGADVPTLLRSALQSLART
jgi:Holliday junction DNA helicase RuvA